MRARILAVALALLGGSCSKSAGPAGAPRPTARATPLVARVGGVELREEDVQRAMSRDPGAAAARFAEPSARRELVDGLVRFQLLAQAAEREGFTQDPDAIHALQQIAVTKLVNAKLGEAASPESISQADIEQDYLVRQARDYTLPPAARVRHIRVGEIELAERVASLAKALSPSDAGGFSKLVARFSEDAATRSSEGELGYVDTTSTLPAALVNAALGLRAPGDVAGPIETPVGYEIVRLVDRRAAAVSPLSSVAESIRQRLYRERRAKALDQYLEQLRRDTPVELAEAPVR